MMWATAQFAFSTSKRELAVWVEANQPIIGMRQKTRLRATRSGFISWRLDPDGIGKAFKVTYQACAAAPSECNFFDNMLFFQPIGCI